MLPGKYYLLALWFPLLFVFRGCATVNPRLDYERTAEHITETTGQENVYLPGDEDIVAGKVKKLLSDGITVGEAVQVCLLNNPSFQAAAMEVGMARADVVQSGLLSNPSVGVALRLPAGGGLSNLEADLAQNIADLWQIPVRKRAAERSLDRAILELARLAADLAADAKAAYYTAVGSQQRHEITRENLAIVRELLEMALALQEAGAGSALHVNLSRTVVVDAELAMESARLAAADARRELARLLGIRADADRLVLTDPLPEPLPEKPDADALVQVAREKRLDILAAQQAVMAAEAQLEEQYRMIFPSVEVGVALERGERGRASGRKLLADTARASIANGQLTAPEIQPRSERKTNTDFIIGPSLGMEIPIFDQNQAQIAKADFMVQQATKALEALDRAVTQEVRSAVDRAMTAWKLTQMYRDQAIPLVKENLELSRESYRAGKASFLAVLEAQRFFLDNRSRYVEASQAAALTIPELERTIGLPFQTLLREAKADSRTDAPTTQPIDGEQP